MSYSETAATTIPVRTAEERSRETQPISAESHAHVNVAPNERLASALIGVTLGCLAFTKKDGGASALRAPLAAFSTYLIYRSVTGNCPLYSALRTGTNAEPRNPNAVIPHGQGIKIDKAITIQKSAAELYSFWRNFENLPRFMKHLEAVSVMDDTHSTWRAKAPLGQHVSWKAQLIVDEPNERIAWRSIEPMDIPNAGTVLFKELPSGRGTTVEVTLEYNPPAGMLGALVAKLFGEEPGMQVEDDLRRFKQLMETGEISTNEGQPHGVQGHYKSPLASEKDKGNSL
jgi:uncharacterized membrane protein